MAGPARIGDIVESERQKIWRRSPGLGLQQLWQEAVGDEVAAVTRVRTLRQGVMTVSCASSGWACELSLMAPELTERLNQAGPPEEVREIRFVHQAQERLKYRK